MLAKKGTYGVIRKTQRTPQYIQNIVATFIRLL